MDPIRLGIIREGKVPPDKRVPFTPLQTEEIQQRFPHVKVVVQKSDIRCFKDEEYAELDIEVADSLDSCDIIMGIKEVPIPMLIENKMFIFFSHTIKRQPYNKKLLQEILKKNVRLVDYEALRDKQGNRLVAFGRYAGIVGAYNGLWTYGKRYGAYSLRRAYECFDINDLKLELRKVKLPPIKIIVTGGGRVGKGAMETLDTAGIRKVNVEDFLYKTFDEAVYVQLGSHDYHIRREGGHFNREEFHLHPERYDSTFGQFTRVADILLAGAYWNPAAPVLFTPDDMHTDDFKIRIVADITCDIEGSIPCTKKPSTIPDPIYDYDPTRDAVAAPLSGEKHITVMAVDNLPCELPRSASDEFGHDLIDKILRPLLVKDNEKIIERAMVTRDGKLTHAFKYLTDYVS